MKELIDQLVADFAKLAAVCAAVAFFVAFIMGAIAGRYWL